MISVATQTLADFITSGIPLIKKEQISFDHPRVTQTSKPALNLYCYRVQVSEWNQSLPRPSVPLRDNPLSPTLGIKRPVNAAGVYQWFDLTFLVSVTDHTALSEQHLLSELLAMLSSYQFLPDEFLSPLLQGQGVLPITVSTEGVIDTALLWQVLRMPLRLALHVTLTVPFYHHLGFHQTG
ncbi:MAG: Pvc16 family protein [Cyanobacteria bacterium P01_C01_bin.118]